MKKIIPLIFVITVLFLSSCTNSFNGGGTGSLSIRMPSANSRSIIGEDFELDGVIYDRAVIYLKNGNAFLSMNTDPMYQVVPRNGSHIAYPGEMVVLPNVPVGTYEMLVSLENSSEVVVGYGNTGEFTVLAGETVPVTLKLYRQKFNNVIPGKDIVSVAVVGSNVFSLTSDGKLYHGLNTITLPSSIDAAKISSLSTGAFYNDLYNDNGNINDELWININDYGIFPYHDRNNSGGYTFDEDFSLATSAKENAVNIDYSYSMLLDAALISDKLEGDDVAAFDEDILVVFFRGSGEDSTTLGGTGITYDDSSDPSGWDWFGLADAYEDEGIEDLIGQFSEIISGVVTNRYYAALASPIGDYFISIDDINAVYTEFEAMGDDDSDIDIGSVLEVFDDLVMFYGDDSLSDRKILKLTEAGNIDTQSSELYAVIQSKGDSPEAIYYTSVNVSTNNDVTKGAFIKVIESSNNMRFTKLTGNPENGKIAVATEVNDPVSGEKLIDSIIIIEDGLEIGRFPFYSGINGDLQSLAWLGNTLYVAGTEGLSYVDCSYLPVE